MAPHWLGSPQHLVAGALLAFAATLFARRHAPLLLAFAAGLTITMAAEALVELVEYPLVYGDGAKPTAYYDTIGDIGITLVGAVAGAVAAVVVPAKRHKAA